MTEQTSNQTAVSDHMKQSLGDIVPNWTTRPHPRDNPQHRTLQGQYCRLELLNSKTNDTVFQQLYDAFKVTEAIHFTYLNRGPFESIDNLKQLATNKEKPSSNTVLYTILVNGIAVGCISYCEIFPDRGRLEIGSVVFSQQLARTRQATEAIFLLLEFAFGTLGYRRVQWKSNTLNMKSRRAARRFGFQYEGTFLKAGVFKDRSRDTAYYSMVDDEWPAVKQEFERWLNPNNFDADGQQLSKLNSEQVNSRQPKIPEIN